MAGRARGAGRVGASGKASKARLVTTCISLDNGRLYFPLALRQNQRKGANRVPPMDTLTTGNIGQSTVVPGLSPGGASAAFGDFLRNARERRGLTLQQVARETKIQFRYLDAIEHGDLSALPEGIYRRAQIRAFAQSVGVDQHAAIAELERALEASKQLRQTAIVRSETKPRTKRGLTVIGVIALSSLALTAVAWWPRVPASRPGVATPALVEPQTLPATATTRAEATPVERTSASPPTAPAPEVAPAVALADAAPPTPAPLTPPVVDRVVDSGQLTIVTEPAGARVTINGMGRGTTPLTIANAPLGIHRIRVTLDGFLGQERTAHLDPSRPNADVRISLQPAQ